MALREPSIVERHVAEHFVPWAIGLGIAGVLVVGVALSQWSRNPTFTVFDTVLGLWIAAGPWMSRRLVRRWDAGER